MIRVNLINTARGGASHMRSRWRERARTIALGVVMLGPAAAGWVDWVTKRSAAELAVELATTQQEAAQVRSVVTEVHRLEDRLGELRRRSESLAHVRARQAFPIQLLDGIREALPDTLWLTELTEQTGRIAIDGRAISLTAVPDFVATLGDREPLRSPIEIVTSQEEPGAPADSIPMEALSRFTVKAQVVSQEPQ